MRRRCRCQICGQWFLPHLRVGARQHVCSNPLCQRERHRRNCADWHLRNEDYDREDRLRRKLLRETVEEGRAPPPDAPLGRIDWQAARDLVGLEVALLIEETGKVLLEGARDSVSRQSHGFKQESDRLPPGAPRDEIGGGFRET